MSFKKNELDIEEQSLGGGGGSGKTFYKEPMMSSPTRSIVPSHLSRAMSRESLASGVSFQSTYVSPNIENNASMYMNIDRDNAPIFEAWRYLKKVKVDWYGIQVQKMWK